MNILKVLTPNRIIGNRGERAAAVYLMLHGYRIICRNYKTENAEIDIIARKKNITAFIEVKTRNVKHLGYMESRPASAVTPEKQRKIIGASTSFRKSHPFDTRMRYDIIEVYIEGGKRRPKIKEIRHLEASFDLNSAFNAKYYYQRKKERSNL